MPIYIAVRLKPWSFHHYLSCKRDCNIFFNFWFDILEENDLSFLEKMTNHLIPESMFSILQKKTNRLFPESMFSVLQKTDNRLEKTTY